MEDSIQSDDPVMTMPLYGITGNTSPVFDIRLTPFYLSEFSTKTYDLD